MSERKRYGFEEALNLSIYTSIYTSNRQAKNYYYKFLSNLCLDPEKPDSDLEALLKRYVANVHVNCAWYNNQVRSEKFLQAVYFGLSVVLLLLVPFLIYASPIHVPADCCKE